MEPHAHNLTLTTAKTASCTEDGNTSYYVCGGDDSCGKWFSDAYRPKEGHDGRNQERAGFPARRLGEAGRKDQKMSCACGNLYPAGILSQHRQENLRRGTMGKCPLTRSVRNTSMT